MAEVWRPVVGWEGVYEVSSEHRVRRMQRGQHTTPGRLLQTERTDGNPTGSIRLSFGGRKTTVTARRLVRESFPDLAMRPRKQGGGRRWTLHPWCWDAIHRVMVACAPCGPHEVALEVYGTTDRSSRRSVEQVMRRCVQRGTLIRVTTGHYALPHQARALGPLPQRVRDVLSMRACTIEDLARACHQAPKTVYDAVSDLRRSGVPITSEIAPRSRWTGRQRVFWYWIGDRPMARSKERYVHRLHGYSRRTRQLFAALIRTGRDVHHHHGPYFEVYDIPGFPAGRIHQTTFKMFVKKGWLRPVQQVIYTLTDLGRQAAREARLATHKRGTRRPARRRSAMAA